MKKLRQSFYQGITLLLDTILRDILFPTTCLVCDMPGDYICSYHKKYMQKYPDSCYVCRTPTHVGSVCVDHMDAPCVGVIISFYYTRIVKMLIHYMKYRGVYDIASFFAKQRMFDLMTHPILWRLYQKNHLCITYVPMHPHKITHQRGYNQAEKLASALSHILHIPYLALCEKVHQTQTQSSLTRHARQQNTRDIYVPIADLSLEHYSTVLLIDDVCTTGATLDACAICIKSAYPHLTIWGLTIARNT